MPMRGSSPGRQYEGSPRDGSSSRHAPTICGHPTRSAEVVAGYSRPTSETTSTRSRTAPNNAKAESASCQMASSSSEGSTDLREGSGGSSFMGRRIPVPTPRQSNHARGGPSFAPVYSVAVGEERVDPPTGIDQDVDRRPRLVGRAVLDRLHGGGAQLGKGLLQLVQRPARLGGEGLPGW